MRTKAEANDMDSRIARAREAARELNDAIAAFDADAALARRLESGNYRVTAVLEGELLSDMRAAVAERTAAEHRISDLVGRARDAGASWAMIGTVLGVTGEAVRQRYGKG